jgi:hypothetical protein
MSVFPIIAAPTMRQFFSHHLLFKILNDAVRLITYAVFSSPRRAVLTVEFEGDAGHGQGPTAEFYSCTFSQESRCYGVAHMFYF